MSSSANQQSRVTGLRRPNKRARVEVDPALAEERLNLARMRRDWEDTLAALARFQDDHVREIRANLFEEIEKLMAEDDGVVAEDGFDDGGPPQDFGPNYGYQLMLDADRPRCVSCNKFLVSDGSVHMNSSFSEGSVYDPVSFSSSAGCREDPRELEDDGASA